MGKQLPQNTPLFIGGGFTLLVQLRKKRNAQPAADSLFF